MNGPATMGRGGGSDGAETAEIRAARGRGVADGQQGKKFATRGNVPGWDGGFGGFLIPN